MELRATSNAVGQSSSQLRSQGMALCREAKEKGYTGKHRHFILKPNQSPPTVLLMSSIDWGLLVDRGCLESEGPIICCEISPLCYGAPSPSS